MATQRYNAYLKSTGWKERRRGALKRSGGTCEVCHIRPATQVHHLNYANIGAEKLEDLQAICVPCHQEHHPDKDIARRDPGYIRGCREECELCGWPFHTIYSDGRVKHYICEQCCNTYRRGERMKRTISCPEGCQKRFTMKRDLRKHIIAVHGRDQLTRIMRKYEAAS